MIPWIKHKGSSIITAKTFRGSELQLIYLSFAAIFVFLFLSFLKSSTGFLLTGTSHSLREQTASVHLPISLLSLYPDTCQNDVAAPDTLWTIKGIIRMENKKNQRFKVESFLADVLLPSFHFVCWRAEVCLFSALWFSRGVKLRRVESPNGKSSVTNGNRGEIKKLKALVSHDPLLLSSHKSQGWEKKPWSIQNGEHLA